MEEIYDKLNSHEFLNYNDFRNFIYYYSKGKVKIKFIDMKDEFAYYHNLTNTIFVNKKYRSEEIKHLINFFKEEFKTIKEKNFLVDLYNLNSLTTLLHELRHAKQFNEIRKSKKTVNSKLNLIIENYILMANMPNLYKKNHDLYYFEYDAVITSLKKTLDIIDKCKDLSKDSIISYNKQMACLLYHSYGYKYPSNDNVSKIYDKFESPISYSTFLSRIIKDKRKKELLEKCIKDILNKSTTEYLKLLHGCKLSYETTLLLYNISMNNYKTCNMLDDVKKIDNQKVKTK